MKFKLTESKLRKIIRAQMKLAEAFTIDTIGSTEISDCNLKVDAGFSGQIKATTVSAANTAAKLYGVPGSFCAIIAAATPGVYQDRAPTRSRKRSESGEKPGQESQSVFLLNSVREKIEGKSTIYCPIMVESPASPSNEGAWTRARANYERLIDTSDEVFLGSDPKDVSADIVNDFFGGYGSAKKINKEIDKLERNGLDASTIMSILKQETRGLMNAHVKAELAFHRKLAEDNDAPQEIITAITGFRASNAIT